VLLVGGLLAVAALAAYHNTFLAPFVLDDGGSITENATIRHLWPLGGTLFPPGGGVTVSGRPVANFSLAVNYAISGDEVWSYHAFNLAIHFLAACTLFGVVRRTLGRPLLRPRFGEAQLPLAAAVAGIWLLHPLQTESVTYVSQRTESLAGLFCLLTLYGFIRAVSSPRPWPWRVLTVLACLGGVGTKEVAATAPLLVFLYDRTFVAGTFREAWRRRRWLHLSLAATWVPLALLVASTGWNRGGTAGFNAGVSPWAYWCTQFEAVARYLKQALWPHPLIFEYGTFWVGFWDAAPFALIVLPLAAATMVALLRRPVAGFLGAWFFAILALTSAVPGTNQMIVEHRMYLPLAAVVALAVTGLHAVLGRRSLVLWPVLAVGLGWLTFVRNETYGSELALWRDTVAKVPRNARARYNLGIVYSEQGRYAQAVAQEEAALQPDDREAAAEAAPAIHNKLGYDLAMLGRVPEAVAHYEQALRLKPDYGLAHLNLARALVRLDRYPEAIRHYEEALRLKIGGAEAEAELSDALLHEGRVEEAIAHCRAALRLTPTWAPGYNNLGYALLLTGRIDEAIAAYREAARLNPRYAAAWVGLGYALIQAGRPAEAVAPCTEAVRLQLGFADAHNTLGIAFAQTGRTAEAIACFEQALRLDAGGADVHNNLGNALAAAGRTAEAIAQYREALRLNPDYAPAHRNLGEELRRAGREAEAAEHLAAAARLETAGESRRPTVRPPDRTPAGD
jgi:tetratricopeptide (TPR) repeat protein